jgi:hypothetical protein
MRIVVAILVLTVSTSARTLQVAGSSDCRALRLMERLARIDTYMPASSLEMIRKQQQVSCAAPSDTQVVLWSTGEKAKYPDGTWVFPNGITALFREGRFGYPKGTPAKLVEIGGTTTWRYPNGEPARLEDGSWRLPDGSFTTIPNLVAWACSRVSASVCEERRADISSARGDEADLSIIELAWLAK